MHIIVIGIKATVKLEENGMDRSVKREIRPGSGILPKFNGDFLVQ